MASDPWTDPDPQRGDFDAYLTTVDRSDVEVHEGDPDAGLAIALSVRGEDAMRLQRIADRRGEDVEQVISDLLRDSDQEAV